MLAPGGRVICTWPAVERRLVEPDLGDAFRHVVTPDRLLETWFGIRVVDGPRDSQSFFNRRAFLSDSYGLGDNFRKVFEAALQAGWYSRLVEPGSVSKPPSFKFGTLCLQRDIQNPKLFRCVTR